MNSKSEQDDFDRFLAEDIGSGDITTATFVPDIDGSAVITCEDDAVVSGLEEATVIFSKLGVKAEQLVDDGTRVCAGTQIMKLIGPLRGITTAERTALNMMMRMSGISTAVYDATMLCRKHDANVKIAGTRKTTPGFRKYEKKAIVLGGGDPHRFGLDDLVLVKDNHIQALGGIEAVMEKTLDLPYSMGVEVEVETLHDAEVAAKCGADIIMMDNRTPEEAAEIYRLVKSINPDIMVEASGRITIDNVADYACVADRISMGSITHSVKAIHFSLSVE
ncbi:MAG: carboxylating nicotinate-nucleotide diphosphorylase [Candidatus Methanomethylophilaceae archaeon]|nr:carboxylating nicotinate-nucleotide diphosphorylase [Candidatus Methanomethylophilaceae archaeon]